MAEDGNAAGKGTARGFLSDAVIIAIVGLVSAAAGAWISAEYGFLNKDRELNIRLVEIGIGILRADPKDGIVPARGWAIELIEKNSGLKFSDADRKALLHEPLQTAATLQADPLQLQPTNICDYDVKDGKVVVDCSKQHLFGFRSLRPPKAIGDLLNPSVP